MDRLRGRVSGPAFPKKAKKQAVRKIKGFAHGLFCSTIESYGGAEL